VFLAKLSLQNFRNYQEETFEFSGPLTLIVGPNTSGKTNLLEAISLLATGRSFRAEVEAEMISDNKQMSNVKCQMSDKKTLEIILTRGEIMGRRTAKKIYKINGVPRRMIDFVGQLKAVYFGPEDLRLVTDSPSLRRRYLDMVLSQVDWEYRRATLSYQKGLRQRNKILEKFQSFKVSKLQSEDLKKRLYFWDQLLVKNGNYLSGKREEYIDFINQFAIRNSQFAIEYLKSVISPAALAKNFEKEVMLGMTMVGPHRDEIKFEIRNSKFEIEKGRDLSLYGSRGEQRLAIFWLKIGEL